MQQFINQGSHSARRIKINKLQKNSVMEENKMKKHVTIVAALRIGLGILGLVGALVVWFVMEFALSQIGGDEIAVTVVSFIKIFVSVIIGFMSVLGIIAGIGLMAYQGWARILAIIVSAINCLNVPIGTLVGVYSIWTLVQDETIVLFRK
jgi:hypothetical protein